MNTSMFTWVLSLVCQSTAPLGGGGGGKMGVYNVDIIVVMSYTQILATINHPFGVVSWSAFMYSDIMVYLVHTPIN